MSSCLRRTVPVVAASAVLLFVLPAPARACDEPRPPQCLAPSGGPDDTALLQAALDRCAGARRPCAVNLCEGVFPTGILRVRDFRGTLRGAGPDKTVLRALPELPTSQVTPDFYREDPFSQAADPWPYLVQLVEGRARVLDLAIEVPDPGEGRQPTTGWFLFGFRFAGLRGGLLLTGREAVSFEVRHVRVEASAYTGSDAGTTTFIGASCEGLILDPDPPAGYPADYPVLPFKGSCGIRHSEFLGVLRGTSLSELAGAKVLVAGNRYRAGKAVEVVDADRSRIAILGNEWDVDVRGVQVQQNLDGRPSRHSAIEVSRNRGRVAPSYLADGLSFEDPFEPSYEPGETTLRVTRNRFTIGDANLPATDGLKVIGASHLQVLENRLGGRVLSGLTVDRATGCRLWRNAFDWELAGTGPDLRLGPDTSGCVAWVGPDDVVVDEGRDNRVVRRPPTATLSR
jgi:hypothetical protein